MFDMMQTRIGDALKTRSGCKAVVVLERQRGEQRRRYILKYARSGQQYAVDEEGRRSPVVKQLSDIVGFWEDGE